MSRTIHRRTFLTTAAAAVAAVAVSGPARADAPGITTAFELPGDRVYPEGIALDPRTGDVYVGSYGEGTVYRTRPGRRTAEVLLPAGTDGRHTANGLRVDAAGRLWVTDSTAGVCVYDPRTRDLLARFDVPGPAPFLVNDLAITADGTAYLTDSVRAVLYRVTPAEVSRGGRGVLRVAHDLSGALAPRPAGSPFSLNGVVTDGRRLFVVDMPVGELFRVDPAGGAVRRVELLGGDLRHGDGLELAHGTLWAAHNATDTLTRWRLAPDGRTARLERTLTDPALQIPTTLVRHRGRLLVVRSQFDKGGPFGPGVPETPFSVAAVRGI
ncbi:SMP-30/gluconolactonase/LRE family protein [Streptomyces sp. NPDC053367]|uniref:SMP-30/gluconolactonase/LRE family protein n=1 Tax=Streptomyces sp. NPDC053367 TaxID=3365700 RepID=UPI0037D81710